jgi:nucleotide-binding universal stress UspA family protein
VPLPPRRSVDCLSLPSLTPEDVAAFVSYLCPRMRRFSPKNPMETNELTPIICGIDFSENAKKAASTAALLASRLGKPLLLVHVTDQLYGLNDHSKELVELRQSLEKQLQDEADRLSKLGASVETMVLRGQPIENALKELGKERNAALMVVSSVSKTAFNRWTLGSVSEHLAQADPVPTLVVRDAAPFEAWASGQRALKVFVGTDFTASSEAALRWAAELRRVGPIDVLAGYVDWPPQEATRLGLSGELKLGGDLPMMQRMIERDLRENVTQLLGEDHVSVRAIGNWGRPDMPLVEMAIEAQADLIVVGTHQWSGLNRLRHGSVSRGILRHAPMSVVCVPTSAVAPEAEPHLRECRRVLVAVDLNDPHSSMVSYGYSIIQPGGTVRLIHNLAPRASNLVIDALHQGFPAPDKQAGLVAEMIAQLHALVPREAEARDITTEVEVTEKRETAKAICAAAERFNADIVCIGGGTRLGPMAKAKTLGSVSLAVLQGSRRPVLVVWPSPDHLP